MNADSLKLQLLTARKKEWWPATADSLPQAVTCQTVKHTALAGIELATFRLLVRRASGATNSATFVAEENVNCCIGFYCNVHLDLLGFSSARYNVVFDLCLKLRLIL